MLTALLQTAVTAIFTVTMYHTTIYVKEIHFIRSCSLVYFYYSHEFLFPRILIYEAVSTKPKFYAVKKYVTKYHSGAHCLQF